MSARKSKLDWMKDLRGAGLTDAEFRVLVIVATYSNASRDNAYPGLDNIAKDARCTRRTARRAMKSLVERGWVILTDEGGNQYWKGKANVYAVRTPADPWVTARPDNGVTTRPKGVTSCTKGVTSRPQRGAPNDPPSGPYIRSLHHSEFYNSGSAQAPTAHDHQDKLEDEEQERANDEELEADYEWISDQVDGFDGYEESTANGMLANGVHPKAIINKINKDRNPV